MKTSFVALTFLIIGVALGWVIKPSSEAPAPEDNLASASGASILESASTGSTQGYTGQTSKNLAALLAFYEDDSSNTGDARAYQFLSSFSPKELRSLAQSIGSIENGHRHYWPIIQAIAGRWSEIDPEGLFKYALTSNDINLKQRCISRAIGALAKRDRARARALLGAIDDDSLRRQASRLIIQATAKDDPKAALAALGNDVSMRHEHQNIFNIWGATAPQEAAKHLATLTNGTDRHTAIKGLARSWGAAEPEAALDWAMTLKNPVERRDALQRILGTVSDVAIGPKLLDSLDLKGELRKKAIHALARNVFRSDLNGALSWTETLTPRERNEVIAEQLYTLSQRDPLRASQLFLDNPSSRMVSVADDVGENLAKKDPQSAKAWFEALPPGQIKDRALDGVIEGLSSRDPKAAATYLKSLDLPGNKGHVARSWFDQDQAAALAWIETQSDPELTSELLRHWSSQDPEAAMNYAHQMDDPSQQVEARQNILTQLALLDPEKAILEYKTLETSEKPGFLVSMIEAIATTDIAAAVEVFESSIASSSDQNSHSLAHTAHSLVNTWAGFDIKAAAEWSASLDEPNARAAALRQAAGMWISQDSLAASEWIGELPGGPGRDASVSALISHIRKDDPSTAFVWANTLGDENRRSNELRNLLRQWKQTDPTAALQALQSANLSDDAYNSIAKQLAP